MKTTINIFRSKMQIFLLLMFVAFFNVLYAQTELPGGYYWSLDAGVGTTDILVKGMSYQFIIDPKLWLSPEFMVGSKFSVNYSTDKLLAFEEQLYLRWNFLRPGNPKNPVNLFLQGGIGMLTIYKGTDTLFGNISDNRGSFLAELAAGVTIPLSSRWHIEPSVRGGYPHIMGASITAGYKFPMPQRIKRGNLAYSDEVVKRILIAGIDSIMFGPDTDQYNADIDQAVKDRNETILNSIAVLLKKNPDFRVRIEGHANPVKNTPDEVERLITLSKMRANTVAEKLKTLGVKDEQMFVFGFGGAKTISYDIPNMNRRVELMVIQVNTSL